MSDVSVSVFARTDIGMQRAGNEDAFLVADLTTGNVGLGPEMSTHKLGDRGSLMVVSDGMGGAVAGEIASELAVATIREALLELPLNTAIAERLRKAAEKANERIWNHSQQNPELSGMGATLTAALAHGTVAYIAQVGDSRAYLVRGDRIKQLTKDQSLVQLLIDSGAITEDQIGSVPQNVIMQALGTQPTVNVAMTAIELCRDDHLLLCSDGLSNKVTPQEMFQVARESNELTSACRKLVEMANERGGEDNITVIVARFDGVGLHAASESASITEGFRKLDEPGDEEKTAETTSPYASAPPSPEGEEASTLVMKALPSTQALSSGTNSQDKESPQTQLLTSMEEAMNSARSLPATEPLSAIEPLSATETLAAKDSTSASEQEAAEQEAIIEDSIKISEEMPATEPLAVAAPPEAKQSQRPERKSYAMIIIIALISLLLLAAAAYFFYTFYLKQAPTPQESFEAACLIIKDSTPV